MSKGNIPWNKGLKTGPLSDEHKLKISLYNKGRKGKKLTKETREKMSFSATGKLNENASHWMGDNIKYGGIHSWLVRMFGKANKCENLLCVYPRKNKGGNIVKMAKRFEYALMVGKKYERKRENYIMLCPSCHRKYDGQ